MANIRINSTPSRVQIEANTASQTVFNYNFPIKEDSDLTVYQTLSGATPSDADDILTLTTDYTVTGAGVATGGTVVLNTGAAVGDVITIVGAKPIDRNAIYEQLVTITRSDLNNDFNDNVMYDKQTFTLLDEITPKYNECELVSPTARSGNLKLPILDNNEFWVGRGNSGDTPDDITKLSVDTSLAPTYLNGSFVVTESESLLPNSTNLGGLTTGLILNTVTAGEAALTTATEGTDYYAPGGTDVAVADGGTGASTASSARTNLGLGTIATQDASSVAITGGTAVLTSLQLGAGATPTLFDTDDTLAADSDTRVPTQQAVKAYVDNNSSPGIAKSWGNFDTTGTVALTSSYNVTSVTDVSPGVTTVALSVTMADSDYAVVAGCSSALITSITSKTTTSFVFNSAQADGTPADTDANYFAVYGDLA